MLKKIGVRPDLQEGEYMSYLYGWDMDSLKVWHIDPYRRPRVASLSDAMEKGSYGGAIEEFRGIGRNAKDAYVIALPSEIEYAIERSERVRVRTDATIRFGGFQIWGGCPRCGSTRRGVRPPWCHSPALCGCGSERELVLVGAPVIGWFSCMDWYWNTTDPNIFEWGHVIPQQEM